MNKKDYLKSPEGSIFSDGYGTIAKSVMQDITLTIEAKAIYSYICSYMGTGDRAFPSVKKICFDLQISIKRFYKHFDQLIEKGYIKKHRAKWTATQQFANNIYELVYVKD